MLAKENRLSRKEFNQFFTVGRRYHSPSLQIVYSPEKNFHASVVVSKKIASHAVVRNKIRRRIYDILRHIALDAGMVGVFIILTKPGIAKIAYETLREEIQAQLVRIIK